MESPKEENKFGYRGFVPKEGPIPDEYAQAAQRRLRDLITSRDNLTKRLLEINPKNKQQFDDLHKQIVIANDAIKKMADKTSKRMDELDQDTRTFLEQAINPKKDTMH